MLIVAALNLPYTAAFEEDEQHAALEEQQNAMHTAQSLVNKEQDAQDGEEVPFDFVEEGESEDPGGGTERAHAAAPGSTLSTAEITAANTAANAGANAGASTNAKQGGEASTASNAAGSVTSTLADAAAAAGTFAAPSSAPGAARPSTAASELPASEITGSLPQGDTLIKYNRKEKTTGLPSYTLARSGSAGDYDTRLEYEVLSRLREQEKSTVQPRRKNSSASLMMRAAAMASEQKPFKVVPNGGTNRGLFNAVDSAVARGTLRGYRSVGLMGMSSDLLTPDGQAIVSRALERVNCYVAHASDRERQGHYTHYCKEFLWPTFHCMTPDIPRNKQYEESSWGSYVAVNQRIADKIVEVYNEGDVVWVHDYHLMLVPQMVRKRLPNAAIGFFLHVAFPSSEVFRSLAYRAELLSGVLAANHIGFHIPEYVQHFKMCLARILAVDITGVGVVEAPDHDAFISSLPLGIDTQRLERILAMDDPASAVQQHRRVIRARWPSQILIAARDKADPIRGLPQKLHAFDRFLNENPQWASRVVLVQICSSGYGASGIDAIAERINSRYGDIASGVQPVVLLKQDVKYEQYLALLIEANGFCVTCLRDGMNLTCHEFAEANEHSRMGPLILSEFTGSASVLGHAAILVNPWDQDQLVNAFKSCVEMPRWEREHKFEVLKQAVEKHTAADWAASLYGQIRQAWQDERSRSSAAPDVAALRQLYTQTLPNEKRLFLLEAERPATVEAQKWLQEEAGAQLQHSYGHRKAANGVNGINGVNTNSAHGAHGVARRSYYSTRLPLALRELCSDPRNVVYVISPETPDYMERMFRALPGLGLIAEFGRHVRMSGEEQWTELVKNDEDQWHVRLTPFVHQLKERGLIRATAIHPSSISIEFCVNVDSLGENRDHSMIGEYLSLVNDQYAGHGGVRTKLEGQTLTVYRTSLGERRRHAFQHVASAVGAPIALTVMANQPYSSDSEDVLYGWADSLKTSGTSREVVTLSVGKHPSLAQYMVEGTNSLLNLLHAMRTGEHQKETPRTRRAASTQ